jgi:drug/metabolite transporter (DMT)-like permease
LLCACYFVRLSGVRVWNDVPTDHKFALLYRSLMLALGQTLNVFSVQLLPLSAMTIIQNTQAFWTALLGYLINSEAFLRIECVGMFASFIGVLLMAHGM